MNRITKTTSAFTPPANRASSSPLGATSIRRAPGFRGLVCLLTALAALTVNAFDPEKFAVRVSATVETAPPRIQLQWPRDPDGAFYEVFRKAPEAVSWGEPIARLEADATGFSDENVEIGRTYEYQIKETTSIFPWPAGFEHQWKRAYGYISAAIEAPLVEYRGKIILIVDNRLTRPLSFEVERLRLDLKGDGWDVTQHHVSPFASPPEVKSLIQSEYQADPARVRSVFLIGHVPVPYSGDFYPDLHESHRGAWPADVYYGEMDGEWTDSTVNSTSAEDPRNFNRPGDGKFDQSTIPTRVELAVGRVDFSDMPAFPESEVELLRRYFDKNHNFRHRVFQAAPQGLIRDNFGEVAGDAPAASAWRNFAPFFGADRIRVVGPGEFIPALKNESFLWAYGGGGGGYLHADGVASTTDFVANEVRSVFLMLHGSFFGDWDRDNVLLRAPLGSRGFTLAVGWVGLPHWFIHPMAVGETIGEAMVLTQNNRPRESLYDNQVNFSAAGAHISLMGDPTLRMHPVAPPSDLTAASEHGVTLNWAPSTDEVLGYHVYRAPDSKSSFGRINTDLVTDSSFTDSSVVSGKFTYMVRAVKLEASPSGSYYNASQGLFVDAEASPGPALPIVTVEATDLEASEVGPDSAAVTIRRAAPVDQPLQVRLAFSGAAVNGADYETLADVVEIPAGEEALELAIVPIPDQEAEGPESLIISIEVDPAYQLGEAASATVIISDAPVNQPPSLETPEEIVTDEDTASTPIELTLADAESPPETLTLSILSEDEALVPLDQIVVEGAGAVRTLAITPAADAHGETDLLLTASDGELSVTQSIHVTVHPINDPPVANDDSVESPADEELVVSVAQLLENDSDLESPLNLTVTGVESPSAKGGLVTLADGAARYTPPAGFLGEDSFQYTVADPEGAAASAQVLVTVWARDRIRSIQIQSDGAVALEFTGVPATEYAIQVSFDLRQWSDLARRETDAEGRGVLDDAQARPSIRKFYRLLRAE